MTVSLKKQFYPSQITIFPEFDLIICCSRSRVSSQNLDKIYQLLEYPLDWNLILQLAEFHGVLPLISGTLKQIYYRNIPENIKIKLKNALNSNLHQNVALTGELIRVSNIFRANNIPFLTFKGPILAQLAYQNLSLRQFLDLDILVPETEVEKISNILIEQGYQPQFSFTKQQQKQYLKITNEHAFWHEEKQISIDLHWLIMPGNFSFFPDPNYVWKNKITIPIFGQEFPTLSTEALLLYLCTHSAKHNWSHLSWICDIAELLNRNPDLNWEIIFNHIGKLGTQKMLFLGLHLAHHLLDADLPQEIVKKINQEPEIIALSQDIQNQLFQKTFFSENPLDQARIYIQTMESPRDKIWYWFNHLITPTPLEWQIIQLPDWLFSLYYPLRLIRLCLKYSKGIFKKILTNRN